MQPFLDNLIDPAGWLDWHGHSALFHFVLGEYGNRGAGANMQRRVRWPGYRVLSPAEATNFTIMNFTGGEEWLPSTGVPNFDMTTLALVFACCTGTTIDAVVDGAALVDKVCRGTQNYNFCIRALNSDRRSASADLLGLARISLDLVRRSASDSHDFVCNLIPSTPDPTMKDALSNCCALYSSALFHVRDAYQYLDPKSPADLNGDMDEVYSEGHRCEDEFKKPGITSRPLGPRNQNLEQLSKITSRISSLL
ncbi:hypothetical protein ACLOJK_017761 [Asimina triloba]